MKMSEVFQARASMYTGFISQAIAEGKMELATECAQRAEFLTREVAQLEHEASNSEIELVVTIRKKNENK